MKKIVLLAGIFSLIFISANAQSAITDGDWQKVIAALNAEDWQTAAALSGADLKKIPAKEKDADQAAILRYMYILSEAGLMNMQKLTQEQAFKNVSGFSGLHIILAGHPISLKEGFNSFEMLNNKTDTLFVTCTNKAATDIYSFEYIIPAKPFPVDDFKASAGKVGRIAGRLKSIKVEGHMFPRFKIIVDEAMLSID